MDAAFRNGAAVIICLVIAGCKATGKSQESPGLELTPEEQKIATELASQAPDFRTLSAGQRVYVSSVELLRDKDAEEKDGGDRKALVTHYRYEGDLTIRTIVDLARKEVVRVESVPHAPTPLATEEVVRARTLALENPAVRQALAPYLERLTVEALVSGVPGAQDPQFGHRVVRLLFKVGSDYLTAPVVHVDLTTESVMVTAPEVMKE